MPIDFRMGAFIGSIFLINFHICILAFCLASNRITENFHFMLNIFGWIYIVIAITAHLRIVFSIRNEMDNPNLIKEPLKISPKITDFKRSPVIVGFVWRLNREWECMKKTANLDFKKAS